MNARNTPGAPAGGREVSRESSRRMRSDPLIAATSGESSRCAVMPSTRSPSARSATDSSPRLGSTRSMYAV